jgi:hypothetical protein
MLHCVIGTKDKDSEVMTRIDSTNLGLRGRLLPTTVVTMSLSDDWPGPSNLLSQKVSLEEVWYRDLVLVGKELFRGYREDF